MKRTVKMDERDQVSTALENIYVGDRVGVYDKKNQLTDSLEAKEEIPFGNKITLADLKKGEIVLKYGEEIGETTKDIKRGELLHIHNVKSLSVDIPKAVKKEIARQMGIEGGVY